MPLAFLLYNIMHKNSDIKLTEYLSQYITEHKKQGVENVLSQRTRHIVVVLEDIFQSQNASAVVRTCECMGLQDIHIVENISKYQTNTRVLKGSDKWMHMIRHQKKTLNNTEECFKMLRAKGYKILVTDPAADGDSIHDVDIVNNKVALVFGNELRGTSQYAIDHCDQKIRIPMFGFTESLNISVSVAICLQTLINKLRTTQTDIGLSDAEKEAIRLEWYRKIVRRSDIIEREFLRTNE
jgi:tRNA (guanosine-2'-O-)-methyltransferase